MARHFDIGPTHQALKGPRSMSGASIFDRGSEAGFILKAPQLRVYRAPWLTSRRRLARAPARTCHNRAAKVQNARAKMAKSSFCDTETGK
jgi:hypothetical protein